MSVLTGMIEPKGPGVEDVSAAPVVVEDPEGDVAVFAERDHTLVMLHGFVDLRCADDLEHAGRFAIDAARLTIMDVSHVTRLDSVGLSFVVRLAAGLRAAGTELVMRGASVNVRDLLTLIGAEDLVRWTSSER